VDAQSDKGKSPMKSTGNLQLTTRGDREIVMTRIFDAPRRLVFDAMTKPELVKQWLLGPAGWTMPVCEIDLRVGGAYRYVWRHTDGKEMGMGGIYREIVRQERLVCTELFDAAWYPGESLVTATLAEQGGRTTLTSTILYVSQETRDTVLKSGMERGVAASYDRLAEVLTSQAAPGMEKGASSS
jgi:uncharacterized protein YndB with AHSA1/START domain